MGKLKTTKQMERHLKGIANHYRIGIILYLNDHEGATLEQIIEALKAHTQTIGEHTRRLTLAGLVDKKQKGKFVEHSLSPYGKIFAKFLDTFRSHP